MTAVRRLGLALAVAAFALLLFKHISYPLLWQDEAETAMFAGRILEYGYPKVHGPKNILYEFGQNNEIGIKESIDAYIGTTWGHFYAAVPALLWSRGAEDPYARTARLRIPFATLGLLGMLCFAFAATPALGSRGRAELFAALFFALACFSVSLILHLRELRYYPLQILLGGAIFTVYLRHQLYRILGFRVYVAALTLLLVLLFNVFFTAYFAFGLLLGLHCLYVGWRSGEDLRARVVAAARGLAPLALSALALIPWFVFFETFSIAGRFSADLGFDASIYRKNLTLILGHLWQHELLAAALVARLLAAILAPERRGRWSERGARSRTSAFLLAFAAGYVAILCVNPLSYERYFLVVSPILTIILLLDAFTLVERLPERFDPRHAGRVAAAAGIALVAIVAATSTQRVSDLRERIYEIRNRFQGPIDHVVAHLRERYERPEDLIIATNYEAHSLMFYLGSRVIIGFSRNNLRADLSLDPDVVIPRGTWRGSLRPLWRFLRRASFEELALPVADTPYNNIAALTRTPHLPMTHRFRTEWGYKRQAHLRVYHRIRDADGEASGGGPVRSAPRGGTAGLP